MTKKELKVVLKAHKLWLESGGKKGSCANLSYANLEGTILKSDNTHLKYVILKGAILNSSDLSHADLSHAYLLGAHLLDADLRYANLNGADLSYTNLIGAIITESQKKYFTKKQLKDMIIVED
jgi:uncharacterized protein YjbI with pentapeptide repeats